ncbi:MAG: GerAB/ArcD/ProY family transporter, partial [Clostridia bacterium]|nr:GerAB/ArcD/ProY family transporter [Clostridia bacterium]
LIFLLLLIPITILFVAGFAMLDYGELRPLLTPDISAIGSQMRAALFSASGIECIFFFLGRRKVRGNTDRAINLAIIATVVLSAVIYIIAVGTLTIDGVSRFTFPLIEMSRIINIGGIALTERFDMLLIVIRIVCVIVQTAIFNYCAALAFSAAFGLDSHRCFIYLLVPVEVVISYLAQLGQFGGLLADVCFYGFVLLTLLFLPILLIIALVRGKKNRRA